MVKGKRILHHQFEPIVAMVKNPLMNKICMEYYFTSMIARR